jgi:hypothetical protein
VTWNINPPGSFSKNFWCENMKRFCPIVQVLLPGHRQTWSLCTAAILVHLMNSIQICMRCKQVVSMLNLLLREKNTCLHNIPFSKPSNCTSNWSTCEKDWPFALGREWVMQCSDVEWPDMIYVKWLCFEVKWVTVKFLGTIVPCTLVWPYTEGTWLCCDYFIWCVSCTVVVWTCFVMCGWVYVCFLMGRCFGNMCTCIYCVLYCLYCVSVLFRLCIFILIMSVLV